MDPSYFKSASNKLETKHQALLLENGIIFQTYNSTLSRMTLKVAKEIVADRIKFCNGVTYPIITDSNNSTKLDSDARTYLSSKEAHYLLCAFALVVKNPFSKLLGNFFLKFEPITVPAKLFTDPKKAVTWINQYRRLN